jgi:hypothetical protein
MDSSAVSLVFVWNSLEIQTPEASTKLSPAIEMAEHQKDQVFIITTQPSQILVEMDHYHQ